MKSAEPLYDINQRISHKLGLSLPAKMSHTIEIKISRKEAYNAIYELTLPADRVSGTIRNFLHECTRNEN
jgi:hypothetical protein